MYNSHSTGTQLSTPRTFRLENVAADIRGHCLAEDFSGVRVLALQGKAFERVAFRHHGLNSLLELLPRKRCEEALRHGDTAAVLREKTHCLLKLRCD